MDNKFGNELEKIETLLNKVDVDLNTDFTKTDFSTFFKNVDKAFEIYNICLEELCGQLYLLELPVHSKVYRKLYHHYKHQLYNIMKYQLTIQKELNEKSEEDKNSRQKIENLSAKLKTTLEKKTRLQAQVEEQRNKIERLILANAQNSRYKECEVKEPADGGFQVTPQAREASRQNISGYSGRELEVEERLAQRTDLADWDARRRSGLSSEPEPTRALSVN